MKKKSSFDERGFFTRLKEFGKKYDRARYNHWTYNSVINLVVVTFLIGFEIVGNYTYISSILTDAPILMILSISALACCSQIGPSFAAVGLQEYLFGKKFQKEKDTSKLIIFWCGLAAFAFVFIFVTVFQFNIANIPFTIDGELLEDVPAQAPKLYAMLISAGRLGTSVLAFGMTMHSYDPARLQKNATWENQVDKEALQVEAEAGKLELESKEKADLTAAEEKIHKEYIGFLEKVDISQKAIARQMLARKSGISADGIEDIARDSMELTKENEI